MRTVYIPIKASEELPPESDKKDISKTVIVLDENQNYIGTDSCNMKLEKWLISRYTAKYWLKKVELPNEKEIDDYAEKELDNYYGDFGDGVEYGIPKGAQFIINKLK